jgi:hypothetical protein
MRRVRTLPCANCGASAHWIRCSLPENGLVAQAYECPKCSFIHAAVEPDPAIKAQGWSKAELRPPER